MTVSTTFNKEIATGNGVATSFPFNFGTLPTPDLVVSLFDLDDVEIPQVEGVDYTITGAGLEDGGAVIFTVAPPNNYTVLILRLIPLTQPTDIKNQGSFFPRTVERAFGDRNVFIDQQQQERIDAAMQLPPQVVGVSTTLPVPEATTLIGWNGDSNALQNYPLASIATNFVYGDKVFNVFTGNGVQVAFTLTEDPGSIGNLDVSIDGVTQVPTADYTLSARIVTFTSPPPDQGVILIRFDKALPIGAADAASTAYTPPKTGVLGTVKGFLDALWTAGSNTGGALVRFLQLGIGAVPLDMQARARLVVHAEDFGAVADFNEGTSAGTDNTVAFARAITYLASIGGGTLRLGRGSYMGRIVVNASNIYVQGEGQWATKLFNVGNAAVFEIDCTSTDVQYAGLKDVLIQNRSKPVYTSADGIFLNCPTAATGSSFLTFENVYVFNMRHCVYIRGRTIWNTWTNVNMSGAIQNGLTIDAFDNAAQQLWLNCRFGASAMHGLLLSHTFAGFPTVGWTFVGCTFEHNILNGIRLTGSISGPQSWKFISCYCEENASGISIGGSGGLQKAHFFCDTPEILGLSIDAGSMFGAKPGDPALDYHIYCNTGGAGVYYGEVMNVRFGVATVNDIFWAKNLILGKNFYSSGSNADWGQGSIRLDDLASPSSALTPAILFGGAGVGMTYGNRKGNWVRHGNLVHFTFYVSLTAKGSSTGTAVVSGLPVAALNVANLYQAVSIHSDQLAAGVANVQARIVPGTTSIEINKFAAGASAATTDADFGNFTALAISGSYIVR
jgi:hypothetical protein